MRRVLVLGADFAPSSLPPALRIRFFVAHLAEFGWEPTVIATDPRYYEWPVDGENTRLVPESVRVIRTPALPPGLTRLVGVGDVGIRSVWHHWLAARRHLRGQSTDVVFIPVPPYVPMVLGRLLHAEFGVPYVVDYIDPWVRIRGAGGPPEAWSLKRSLARGLSRVVEPFALRRVAHLVSVSKGTTESVLSRYPWLSGCDATEIPYGGEPGDFEYLRRHPRPNPIFNPHDGFLHVSYVGVCNMAMRGTIEAVCEAVRRGLERMPAIFGRLRLHFVGTSYAHNGDGLYQVRPIAERLGIAQVVDERPERVSYLDALRVLLDSHGLLIMGTAAPHYTPSKVFPYVLARRPLLAILREESNAVRMLSETGAGNVVTFGACSSLVDRVPEILRWFEEALARAPQGGAEVHWSALEAHTTRAMTARLAGAFEKATEGRREA